MLHADVYRQYGSRDGINIVPLAASGSLRKVPPHQPNFGRPWATPSSFCSFLTCSILDVLINRQHQLKMTVKQYDMPTDDLDLFDELPEPEIIPYADLLETFETVNVLAPLVRCSKLPFRHLTSLYETHVTHTPMILAEEFSRSQIARTSDFTTSKEERGVFWMQPRQRSRDSGEGYVLDKVHPEDAHAGGDQPESSRKAREAWKTYHTPEPHTRLPPTVAPPTKDSRLVRGLLIAQMACPNGPSLADAAELIAPYVDGLDINCGCPQKWAYEEGIGSALLRKPELVSDMVRCVKNRLGWEWPVSVKIRIDPEQEYVHILR
jgi:tRNA-dihydrouridine synthase 4